LNEKLFNDINELRVIFSLIKNMNTIAMKKLRMFLLISFFLFHVGSVLSFEGDKSSASDAKLGKVTFAGGCFWI
jgi:hypothetical protein